MEKIKIKFVDFWYGFSEKENYFTKLLSKKYLLEFSDDPQVIIYSCYGRSHLKYKCTRIYYTAENLRPDFRGCDYAITFDYNENPRHYRFPLYGMYLDSEKPIKQFLRGHSKEEAIRILRSKNKFCCMVVSNGGSQKRLDLFEKLSGYKKVDSGGKVLNNVGGPVADKLKFIKDYRFVIAFENTSHPGYTTEKLVEPFITDCIPLYWGDPDVGKEFNQDSFLSKNLRKEEDLNDYINKIIEIDNNEEQAIELLMQPKFKNGCIPSSIDPINLQFFFDKIMNELHSYIPIAQTWNGKLYGFNLYKMYYRQRVLNFLNLRSILWRRQSLLKSK